VDRLLAVGGVRPEGGRRRLRLGKGQVAAEGGVADVGLTREGMLSEGVRKEGVAPGEGVPEEAPVSAVQLLEEALAVREALQDTPQGQQPPTTR